MATAKRNATAVVVLKVRLKEPLRARVESAARQRGVSMNAEFAHRLAWSFEKEDQLREVFGSKEVLSLLRCTAVAMNRAGQLAVTSAPWSSAKQAAPWWEDPYAFDQATKAALGVMGSFRPPGSLPDLFYSAGGELRAVEFRFYDTAGSEAQSSATPNFRVYGKEIVPDPTLLMMIKDYVTRKTKQAGRSSESTEQTGSGGKHEGQHHAPRPAKLAAKVRSWRAGSA
jgi:hypothetical protein